VEDLEMAVMHLQKALEDLSDMVIKQGKIIEHLERQNVLLQSALETEIVKPLSEETPPPHY
jgi:uncharacterized coiled-coil protein SlyX